MDSEVLPSHLTEGSGVVHLPCGVGGITGSSLDTAFLFGNGAEGVVAVEPDGNVSWAELYGVEVTQGR